jgi:hypothetical protein
LGSDFIVEVLDKDVGELGAKLFDLALTLLFADVVTDKDLFVVQQHAVDGLDGGIGSFTGRVVDKGESARLAVFVGTDLARENVAKSGECVVESLTSALLRFDPPCCQWSRPGF